MSDTRPPLEQRKSKSCLKVPSPRSSTPVKKSVCWCSEDEGSGCLEKVYTADDWDRTPHEPCQPLSYKDILELKAIQRTLPRAQQLPDPYTGKPANQFLSAVPIALLPLLPDSNSSTPPTTPHPTPEVSPSASSSHSPDQSTLASPSPSPPRSPVLRPQLYNRFPRVSSPLGPPQAHIPKSPSPERVSCSQSPLPSPITSPTAPSVNTQKQPWLAHLQPSSGSLNRAPPKPKPSFAFLPLLETPPPSIPPSPLHEALHAAFEGEGLDLDDPPTPALTNASLASGGESELLTSDCDEHEEEGLGLSLVSPNSAPASLTDDEDYHHERDCDLIHEGSHSPFIAKKPSKPNPKPKPKKPKNVMFINGEEISLDSDSEEEEEDLGNEATVLAAPLNSDSTPVQTPSASPSTDDFSSEPPDAPSATAESLSFSYSSEPPISTSPPSPCRAPPLSSHSMLRQVVA